MYYTIYKIINVINGKEYIGAHQTNDLDDGYMGSGIYLNKAIKKYGIENFTKEILKICDDWESMRLTEAYLVDSDYVKNPNTYNLQTGGFSNGVLCEFSKKKISETVKLRHKEGRYKNINRICGHTDVSRKKISNTMKEKYSKQEHHLKGKSPWNKGKSLPKLSESTKRKLSEASTNYWKDPKNRKRVSDKLKKRYSEQEHHLKGKPNHFKGKSHTNESIEKMRQASLNAPKYKCPYCGKIVDRSNLVKSERI